MQNNHQENQGKQTVCTLTLLLRNTDSKHVTKRANRGLLLGCTVVVCIQGFVFKRTLPLSSLSNFCNVTTPDFSNVNFKRSLLIAALQTTQQKPHINQQTCNSASLWDINWICRKYIHNPKKEYFNNDVWRSSLLAGKLTSLTLVSTFTQRWCLQTVVSRYKHDWGCLWNWRNTYQCSM